MVMSGAIIKEVIRPRRHYFWIFGLAILILIGVLLTKYDVTSGFKFSPFVIEPPLPTSATRPHHTQPLYPPRHQTARLKLPDAPREDAQSQNHKTNNSYSLSTTKNSRDKTKTKNKIINKSKSIIRIRTKSNGSSYYTNSTVQKITQKLTKSGGNNDSRNDSSLELRNDDNENLTKTNPIPKEEGHNIVYAKVHKAASSVLQNILLRLAVSRTLNVLFPTHGHIISESSSYIDPRAIVPIPKGEHYNILCNHVIFNKKAIEKYFPDPGTTFYIGIIRHPLRQMSSALYYYATRYKKSNYPLVFQRYPKNPLHGFLSRPYLYDLDPPKHSYVNNRMSIDLGFPVSTYFDQDKQNNQKINKFLSDLDNTFDLILIVELFDESLILLRRLLNWKTVDILYRRINVRSDPDNFKINNIEKDMHKRWAPIDYALYSHFRNKLEKEIVRQGDDFQRELSSYRRIQKKTVKFCNSGIQPTDEEGEGGKRMKVKATEWSAGFEVTRELCDYMSEGETSMVSNVKKKQMKRLKRG